MEGRQKRLNFSDLQEYDNNIIKGIPWAEEMLIVLSSGLTKTFLNWIHIVLKIGRGEDDVKKWVQTFIEHYEDTCLELVSDMELLQSNMITNIEKYLQKVETLCKILQVNMPVFAFENQGLYQIQVQLEKHIEVLKHTIETRKSELNKLQERQLDLCNSLGREMKLIQDNPLPSIEEIQEFQTYIEKLENEKFVRLEKYYAIREEVSAIAKELNFKPSTQFEKDILSSDDKKFLLTEDNMKSLESFQRTLKEDLKIVKEEVFELKNRINNYWNLLEVPFLEQEEFKQKITGHSLDVLESLRIEVVRCENLKRANIKIIVEHLRDQLIEIWNKCQCTESAKNDFWFFNSDCYTEDLLELHECELKKWKHYFEEVKEILALLNDHKKFWFKLIDLEESAADPKRFNNRGGQLLKEEKERNVLMKKIQKIENILREKNNKYEKDHGTPFKTNGNTIEEYIQNLHSEKENVRKNKLSARKIQHESTTVLTPAKSVHCLFPGTSNSKLKTTSKRKLPDTPALNNKKIKTTQSHISTAQRKPTLPKIVVGSVTSSKCQSVERKKRIEKIRRQSNQKHIKEGCSQMDASNSSNYMDFEREISTRNDVRSTMLPATPVVSKGTKRVTPRTIIPENSTPTPSKSPANNNLKLALATESNLNLMF